MNISGLLRSFLGEAQPADAKTLELKVGQIVKGIVLQILSEQDALVNINGVQVRAKLEAPLKQGESTLLQVQPESAQGQPVLKPLQDSTAQIADSSFPALMKELGQKDTAANRKLVLTLQREGVPLTKETVADFMATLQAKPGKVSAEEWTQTAALAYKRGLPLTADTLGALRQTLGGPPLYELVERLGAEAEAQLQDQQLPAAVRQPMQQLAALVRQALGEAAAGLGGGFAAAAPAQPALPGAAGAAAGAPGGGDSPPPARASAEPPAAAAGLRTPAAQVPAAAVPLPPQAPHGAASMAAPGSAAAAAREAAGDPPPQQRAAQPEAPAAAPAQPGASAGTSAAGTAAAQTQAADPGQWIGRLLRALGVEHERELLRLPDKPEPLPPKAALASDGLLQPSAAEQTDADGLPPATTDTLKGLLLQLVKNDDVPAGLKDTLQMTLQQITGQQLLLTPDRSAPFAQVTLFIPFRDEQGQQTASVHIQSRRGSRGQLDASNCRLLFDLYMQQMGNTLLDVQVVDRVVSLNVRNDHPAVPALFDGFRDEIVQSLQNAGYQLLSLKFGPYPTPAEYKEDAATGAQPAETNRQQLKSFMQTKPYKGVDFRV